jgi:hypothetical protein
VEEAEEMVKEAKKKVKEAEAKVDRALSASMLFLYYICCIVPFKLLLFLTPFCSLFADVTNAATTGSRSHSMVNGGAAGVETIQRLYASLMSFTDKYGDSAQIPSHEKRKYDEVTSLLLSAICTGDDGKSLLHVLQLLICLPLIFVVSILFTGVIWSRQALILPLVS